MPPLGIVPNAPNNIKDLLKINEQNIPMYSRNSTSLSLNSSDENLGSMDLISDKSSKMGNFPHPVKIEDLKLPEQQFWGKDVIDRYNNDSGFINVNFGKSKKPKTRRPVAYDDSFLVYDARLKFKRDQESPMYREKTPECFIDRRIDKNISRNSSFNRNTSLIRQTSRSMVDLSFEALTTCHSGAQLINRGSSCHRSRADSALYSRDEATSKISDSVNIFPGDLHFSNGSYNIGDFTFVEDREEQIYENLASILRKTRQLSEAKQREKEKSFGITEI